MIVIEEVIMVIVDHIINLLIFLVVLNIVVMFNKTDIFFIILFIVVLSIIIGLNITMLIDKKINNISINIPPLNIKDKMINCVCNTNKDNVKENNIEEKDKIENFIVSDARDLGKYDDWKKTTMQKSNKFDDKINNDKKDDDKINNDKINNDKKDDNFNVMVIHNPQTKTYEKGKEDKSYITSADFAWDPPRQYVSYANSSIAEKYKTGEKSLRPYKIGCGYPNKLTAENYYNTYYKRQVIPIEDYRIKGHNYMNYSIFPTPYQTRKLRILSDNTKGLPPEVTKVKNIPIGFNYAFHNTPAMPMP